MHTSLKMKISVLQKGIKLFLLYLPKLAFKKTNPKKTNVVCFDGFFSHGLPKHIDVSVHLLKTVEHLKTVTDFIFLTQSENVFLLKKKAHV